MTTELIKLTLAFRGLSDEDSEDGNVDIGDDLGDTEVDPDGTTGAVDTDEEEAMEE